MSGGIGTPEWFLVYNQQRQGKATVGERLAIDCTQLVFEVFELNVSTNMLWPVASQFVNPFTGNTAIG
jgi:hypothetical protein